MSQQGTQAQSVALPTRLPLVVQAENRNEDTSLDAKLLNGYVEKSEESKEYHIYKRPGLEVYANYGAAEGLGLYNWLGDVYAIFGATLFQNGVALPGALDTSGGHYRFSSSLGATPRLQFGNGVATYNYDSAAGIVHIESSILGLDTNFPAVTVKGIGYIDGTTYVMTPDASVRGCADLNDPTLWSDLLNRIDAQIEPDGGVALAKQLVYILALGQWSTEVFYDQANATASPLGPVQGAKINYGCANADSVQDLDGQLLWIATNRGAAPQVLLLENLKPQIVSTKAIERILGNYDLTNIYSFAIKYEGHRFYGITLLSANATFVYDLVEKMWAQWTDSDGNYFPISSVSFSVATGLLLQHATNGNLYQFDASFVTDAGATITFDLYTPNFDGGVRRRKQLKVMEIIADQTVGSILQVRSNDNDYAADKWTNYRLVNLAQKKPTLINNGTFMRRAYHFRHQAPTRFRMQGIELQMDIGTL